VESKRKQLTLRQKAAFELKLKDRLSFLSEKGIKSPKAEKDTLARKLKADIKAMNTRLRLLAENEKRTEEMAKIKAERAAAPKIEAAPEKAPAAAKGEKTKKAPVEGKEKKIKAEKKAAPPKAPEGDKS
jgi:hypothetical protein